ncbi:MAG: hypothetical protein ACK50A_08570 [Sphingobacteriaceae bacterium]
MEKNKINYPVINELLKQSLFSQSSLMEGFSDVKALATIDLLKESYISQVPEDSITQLIDKLLIESIGRSVGHGENHGAGFPFDLLEKFENKFEGEIDETLIIEVLNWKFSITSYKLVENSDDIYFQNTSIPAERILYSTFSKIAFKTIANAFIERYELICKIALHEIPSIKWMNIIGKEHTIEDFL